jgi:preprotein translocase subunit YajC
VPTAAACMRHPTHVAGHIMTLFFLFFLYFFVIQCLQLQRECGIPWQHNAGHYYLFIVFALLFLYSFFIMWSPQQQHA